MGYRRLTTGHDDGRSVVKSDSELKSIVLLAAPGVEFYHIWASKEQPQIFADGRIDVSGPYSPAPGGVRVARVVFPPNTTAAPDVEVSAEAAFADAEAKLPGMMQHLEPDHPGMHTSETVDVGIVESGEVWLELDDGRDFCLRAGDSFVQNGTRHAWHNRSSEPSVVTFVIMGADRVSHK